MRRVSTGDCDFICLDASTRIEENCSTVPIQSPPLRRLGWTLLLRPGPCQ